jgi:hypothetical protein
LITFCEFDKLARGYNEYHVHVRAFTRALRACRNTKDADLCSHAFASLQMDVIDFLTAPWAWRAAPRDCMQEVTSLAAQLLRGALDADEPCSSDEEAGFEYDDGVKIGYLPGSLIYPTDARFEEHGPPAVAPPAVPAGAAHAGGEQGGLVRVPAMAAMPPCGSGLDAVVLGKRAAPDGPDSDDEVALRPRGPPLGAAVCQPVPTLPSIVPCENSHAEVNVRSRIRHM